MKIKEKEHIVEKFLGGIDFDDNEDYYHEISTIYPESIH